MRRLAGAVLRVVGSGAVLSGLVTLLVVWGAGLALSLQITPTYESRAIVVFEPRTETVGAETMVLVLPKYVEMLRGPEVMDVAALQLGESPAALRTAATGVIEPNTLNLQIRMTASDPEIAAERANVAAAGVLRAASRDSLVRAELIASAVPAGSAALPSAQQVRLLGLLLGLGAALLVGAMAARRGGAAPATGTVAEDDDPLTPG